MAAAPHFDQLQRAILEYCHVPRDLPSIRAQFPTVPRADVGYAVAGLARRGLLRHADYNKRPGSGTWVRTTLAEQATTPRKPAGGRPPATIEPLHFEGAGLDLQQVWGIRSPRTP